MSYMLSLWYDDLWVSKYFLNDNIMDITELYEETGADKLIRTGLEAGHSIDLIKSTCLAYMLQMVKNKAHCYKIRKHDHDIFLASFVAYHKLKGKNDDLEWICLKNKKTNLKKRKK